MYFQKSAALVCLFLYWKPLKNWVLIFLKLGFLALIAFNYKQLVEKMKNKVNLLMHKW
ncbi:hypothetical protein Gohar_010196 [Gossypium harknessii]|uniref:Uncharacterized protein n=1 Tax=Gossypium harknessii TaxID=34285 RepID=A0A7J9GQ52_9ROSI|nr:hypothetical protein [Gossypium harknessii]